ncbi:hypothetical protein GX51_06135 [Blastomyces parvus]|uniref:AB hydrolase-1 domain-containing protein n=1 Tax=Blastomyces parvus TaxID=2060905 RepID=A0A2B7WK63_9EURO|nr:hypothetical protein GX51_06135 [Blastomyces parvus]
MQSHELAADPEQSQSQSQSQVSSHISLHTLPSGRKLAYHLSGPANGPLLLLANPLLTNFSLWDPILPTLHAHNYRVLRYDPIGHGSSSPPPPLPRTNTIDDTDTDTSPTTLPTLAADLYHLLTTTLRITTIHAFIGVSLGAATGLYLAVAHPGLIQRLVACSVPLCAPINAGVEDQYAPLVEIARINADATWILTERTLERWFGVEWRGWNAHGHGHERGHRHGEGEMQRLRALMQTTTREGFIACCNALRDRSFDLRPLLGRVAGAVERVMFVAGGADGELPDVMGWMREEVVRGFEKEGKNKKEEDRSEGEIGEKVVEWAVIRGAGHLPMIDHRDRFWKRVLMFLER